MIREAWALIRTRDDGEETFVTGVGEQTGAQTPIMSTDRAFVERFEAVCRLSTDWNVRIVRFVPDTKGGD